MLQFKFPGKHNLRWRLFPREFIRECSWDQHFTEGWGREWLWIEGEAELLFSPNQDLSQSHSELSIVGVRGSGRSLYVNFGHSLQAVAGKYDIGQDSSLQLRTFPKKTDSWRLSSSSWEKFLHSWKGAWVVHHSIYHSRLLAVSALWRIK